MAQCGAHCFHTCTSHVDKRILFCKRTNQMFGYVYEEPWIWIFRTEALDNLSLQHTSRTHFCHFHEVVFTDCPEEGQTRCELVNVKACITPVRIYSDHQPMCNLTDICSSTRFLHMVARNGDTVELRHDWDVRKDIMMRMDVAGG